MKKEELEQLIKSKIRHSALGDVVVSVRGNESCLSIKISQMYEYVEVNFETMQELAEIFGSQKINVGSRNSFSGCDTCDYGSEYTVTYHVTDPKIVLE